jgi:predicted nucleic-acid-binding protein
MVRPALVPNMKVAVDTNVLVRAVMRDEPHQAALAEKLLVQADLIAVALASLCEFCWVLRRVYRLEASDIAAALRALIGASNVEVNRPAVEAGLAVLEAGGDFADGVISFEGLWLGADWFASFDKEAVTLLAAQGRPARLLG